MFYPKEEVLVRYPGNPILTPDDMPFACSGVYNSGAVKFGDKYLLVLRVESIDITCCFMIAESDDGYHFTVRPEPIPMPDDEEFREYTAHLIYDPRVTPLEGAYYICFACHSGHGVRVGMMKTEDFESFEWMGFVSEIDNRNAVLFPEKINGSYARLDRPLAQDDRGDIWISYSPDLIHWGRSRCVARRAAHGNWQWQKIGAGAVPIKTPEGWLCITHAVHTMARYNYVYHLGVMLLDLEDPSKVVARSRAPILSPRELYERVGLTSNVVFTSGAVVEPDGEVKVYYGGADTVQCVATTTLDKLIWAAKNR